MARAYGFDLRDRVIDAVIEGGMSCRGAAARFGVGESSAIRWVGRYQKTGKRDPVGTGGHRPSKVKPHREWLLGVLEAEADITLESLAKRLKDERGVKATTGMLSYFFIAERISFKKNRSSRRTGQTRHQKKA
jgi:transposase